MESRKEKRELKVSLVSQSILDDFPPIPVDSSSSLDDFPSFLITLTSIFPSIPASPRHLSLHNFLSPPNQTLSLLPTHQFPPVHSSPDHRLYKNIFPSLELVQLTKA
jgi:hypothetical protein